MQFSKTSFMILLAIILVLPFFVYRCVWLLQSESAVGTMCFMGKELVGQMSNEYPVIKFSSNGKDTVFFNGADGMQFDRGAQMPVRFQKNNPANALVNNFTGMWMGAVIYASIPFAFLLICFIHPGIIPKNSKIQLGGRPFVRLVS